MSLELQRVVLDYLRHMLGTWQGTIEDASLRRESMGMGQAMADAMRQSQQPGAGTAGGAGAPSSGPSVAEQLRELTALHKDGILTAAEFPTKRTELVKRL